MPVPPEHVVKEFPTSLPNFAPVQISAPTQVAGIHFHHGKGDVFFRGETEGLGEYCEAAIGSDLSIGHETFRPNPQNVSQDPTFPSKPDLAHTYVLYDTISKQRALHVRDVQVIGWRGALTKLSQTPYIQESWRIVVARVGNRLVLIPVENEDAVKSRCNPHANHLMAQYSGYKFEQLSTAGADHSTPVDATDNYCSVYRFRLGRVRMLMGAEVDVYTTNPQTSRREYVELKTAFTPHHRRQQDNYERSKLLKYYLQSFYAGIPHVVVGFRSRDWHLEQVQWYKTQEIPRIVRGTANEWDPNHCLAYCERIIIEILTATSDGTGTGDNGADGLYLLTYDDPFKAVVLSRDVDGFYRDVIPPEFRTWIWGQVQPTGSSSGI